MDRLKRLAKAVERWGETQQMTDTEDRARSRSGRSAIRPGADQPPKPAGCAPVKSVLTSEGRGSNVSMAHLRGD